MILLSKAIGRTAGCQNIVRSGDCAEEGMEPEKPFKGTFNIRLDPSLHQRLAAHAIDEGKTLNAFIKDALEKAVSDTHA